MFWLRCMPRVPTFVAQAQRLVEAEEVVRREFSEWLENSSNTVNHAIGRATAELVIKEKLPKLRAYLDMVERIMNDMLGLHPPPK
jgi:hypothetical protein